MDKGISVLDIRNAVPSTLAPGPTLSQQRGGQWVSQFLSFCLSFFLGWRRPNLITGIKAGGFFFLSWVANTQLDHWTKRVVNTRLIMDPRNHPIHFRPV